MPPRRGSPEHRPKRADHPCRGRVIESAKAAYEANAVEGSHLVQGDLVAQGHVLRVAGAENDRDHPFGDILALGAQGVHVGQGELSCLDLSLDLGGVVLADDILQGVAGDNGKPGVAVG